MGVEVKREKDDFCNVQHCALCEIKVQGCICDKKEHIRFHQIFCAKCFLETLDVANALVRDLEPSILRNLPSLKKLKKILVHIEKKNSPPVL